MFLDDMLLAQKRGIMRGVPSICSSHPWVLKESMRIAGAAGPCLIEPTCNQVNQYGGYSGMTPIDFVRYVRGIAAEVEFRFENIILGGDHLGPSIWQTATAEAAMQEAEVLVRDYVRAGFLKIHLDCSMRLGDDPQAGLDPEISARRAARLAKAAEKARTEGMLQPWYVIGTEVPVPGGVQNAEADLRVSEVADVSRTLDLTRRAFEGEGLRGAWERVLAVVVQPGVEFGDDFVARYQPENAMDLVRFIEAQPMVYEAHSTDYQTREALGQMVRDHFAILKVGPALTFAFREAVFALAMMEDQLLPEEERSNLVAVVEAVMRRRPEHWRRYYRGSEGEQAFKRKFSFSDRMRYYWPDPQIQAAFRTLLHNLKEAPPPPSMLSQFAPRQYDRVRDGESAATPEALIARRLSEVLLDYQSACGLTQAG